MSAGGTGEAAVPAVEGLCDLPGHALLRLRGADAGDFLQRMLAGDVRRVSPQRAVPAAWCGRDGRVLAVPLVVALADALHLLLPRSLLPATADGLQRYVLGSDVQFDPDPAEVTMLGTAGAHAEARIEQVCGAAPAAAWQAVTAADGNSIAVRMPGATPCFVLLGSHAALTPRRRAWQPGCTLLDDNAWGLLEVDAGLVRVEAALSGAFLPQMLNLDRIGGLDLDKGCFPGQEVVARLHYRGRLKRRLCRLRAAAPLSPGTQLLNAGGNTVGTVVHGAGDARQQIHALAVVQIDAATAPLHTEHHPQQPLQAELIER